MRAEIKADKKAEYLANSCKRLKNDGYHIMSIGSPSNWNKR